MILPVDRSSILKRKLKLKHQIIRHQRKQKQCNKF